MQIRKLLIPIIIFAVTILGIAIVSQNKTHSNKQKVAASIFPVYDIMTNITGNTLETVLVLPPGASPHTFEPSPNEFKELSNVRTLFTIGHGLDDWGEKMASSAGIINIVTLDKNIDLMESTDKEEGPVDPHYWTSPKNAILIAKQIKDQLSVDFPEYASEFESNYNTYLSELENLDNEVNTDLAKLPRKSFATFHTAWSYFARDYGINIPTTFEEFPGKEPTAEYLNEFSNLIKSTNIKVIFAEPQLSTDPLMPIAKDLGIKISTLDPLGGEPGRDTYISLIRYNVGQIVNALQ